MNFKHHKFIVVFSKINEGCKILTCIYKQIIEKLCSTQFLKTKSMI